MMIEQRIFAIKISIIYRSEHNRVQGILSEAKNHFLAIEYTPQTFKRAGLTACKVLYCPSRQTHAVAEIAVRTLTSFIRRNA